MIAQNSTASKPVDGLAPPMTPPSPTPLPQPAPNTPGANGAANGAMLSRPITPGVGSASNLAFTDMSQPGTVTPPGTMPPPGSYSLPVSTNGQGQAFANPSSQGVITQPASVPQPPTTPSLGPVGGPTSSLAPGVNVTPIDPTNDLRSQTITPGAMADRFKVAQDQLKTYQQASDPYYQKSLRDASSAAAGAGQLGSGQLRTSLGDLALNRDIQLGAQGQGFLQNALSGSIDDAYKNIGIAQQQQGRQDQAQGTAFGQGVTQAALGDQLQTSAENRALQQLLAGESGNPSDTQLILANLYGNNASQAGGSLSNLISGTVNRNAQQQATGSMSQILQSILGGGGAPAPTPTMPTSTGPIVPSTGGTASGGLFDPSTWIRG